MICDRAVAAMECRIKASDLWQFRTVLQERSNWSKIVRLVQRRQRYVPLEASKDVLIDQNGLAVFGPTMNNAMADSEQTESRLLAQPFSASR